MKNFLTSMVGTLVALFIFSFCSLLVMAGLIGAIVSLNARKSSSHERIETGSYLVFDLSSNLVDAPPVFEFGDFSSAHRDTLQLRSVIRAIHEAAADSRIAGIFLKGSLTPGGVGSGYAALQEVRLALIQFRRTGKPVKAYLDFATTRDYYLASAADEINLNPYGLIYMPGLAVEETFFAGALEKYGVGIQVTRVGKYKSFVEPFVRKDMSPENREETQRLIGDIWQSLLADIGRARDVAPARIQATVDREGLIRAEVAKSAHLVDKVAYVDQILDELKGATGRTGPKEVFKQVTLEAYAKAMPDLADKSSGPAIGIAYAEGDIVEGEGDNGQVGGLSFARDLRRVREDDNVKAIVLRVNSPGGSATAAEQIQREVRLARKVKPVIVSMGAYAASGGYWISAESDRIFAEPTTITGSIGVFGIQFDVQKLANDFGITFDSVKTGKFAGALTISRPKTPEEMAVLQRMVDWIYGQFIGKVAGGRKLAPEYVETIAQGRVWSMSSAGWGGRWPLPPKK